VDVKGTEFVFGVDSMNTRNYWREFPKSLKKLLYGGGSSGGSSSSSSSRAVAVAVAVAVEVAEQ